MTTIGFDDYQTKIAYMKQQFDTLSSQYAFILLNREDDAIKLHKAKLYLAYLNIIKAMCECCIQSDVFLGYCDQYVDSLENSYSIHKATEILRQIEDICKMTPDETFIRISQLIERNPVS